MKRVAVIWAFAILVVWGLIGIATLWTRDYTGLAIVTPLMLLATGVVLGIKPAIKKGDE